MKTTQLRSPLSRVTGLLAISTACLAYSSVATALDLSVAAIGGDQSRTLLGDGTDVIVGVIDSGVDETHPTFGTDSLGRAQMVAEGNFVPTEPGNTGDDVNGHGTWIASVIAGQDSQYTGLAPDARFVNARVLDNGNGFASGTQVSNGVGFAIDQGADVLNLSLNYFSVFSSGGDTLTRMIDWAAQEMGVSSAICAGNISQAQNGDPRVRGPGGAFNGMTVGRTDGNFDQVSQGSAHAFTQDGRMKPDVVAPGTSITMANDDWETQADFTSASGCSFATPHVAGLMAQQIEAGRNAGLSTNPLVIKATTMNAADKSVLDKSGNAWEPASGAGASITQPLDTDSGAGQIDGVRLAEQYLVAEQEAGDVLVTGWDLAQIAGNTSVDYDLELPLVAGTDLTATLTWFRNVSRTDRGAVGVDATDLFVTEAVDNLDLQILADGLVIAESVSSIDNVEHLQITAAANVDYSIRVLGTSVVVDPTELFAVAWSAVAVPEPASATLVMLVCSLAAFSRRR